MYSSRISLEERKINDLDEIFVCVCFFFLIKREKELVNICYCHCTMKKKKLRDEYEMNERKKMLMAHWLKKKRVEGTW